MATVYRKHYYRGLRVILHRVLRQLVPLSRGLAFVLSGLYFVLPWLLTDKKTPLLIIAVIALVAAFAWWRLAKNVARSMDIVVAGQMGEAMVARELANLPREWVVLNDLALRAGGPIVQIDHLVITPACLYVLETKSQRGRIRIQSDGNWQASHRGKHRMLGNPQQQNRNQVKACRYLLRELGQTPSCRGLVVTTQANAAGDDVIPLTKLRGYLGQENKTTGLSPQQVKDLARKLLSFQVTGSAPWRQGKTNVLYFVLLVILPLLAYSLILLLEFYPLFP